jgi:hypothetical protein
MDQSLSEEIDVECRREMIVDWCKDMIWMNCRCIINAIIAKIVIDTFEAFMPDSNNVLGLG